MNPLQALPEKIRSILERTPIPATKISFIVYDADGVIRYVSEFSEILRQQEISSLNWVGHKVTDIIQPTYGSDDLEYLHHALFNNISGKESGIPARLALTLNGKLNPKTDFYIYHRGLPVLFSVQALEGLFLCAIYPRPYYMERLKGRLSHDMVAVLDKDDSILVYCHTFSSTLMPREENGRLFMQQLTDPRRWFKLLAREKEAIAYLKELLASSPDTWEQTHHFNPLREEEWIQDVGGYWEMKGNTMRVASQTEFTFITYLHTVEQTQQDVRISLDTDLSELQFLGILFHVDIYRSSTEMGFPDQEGYTLTLRKASFPGEPDQFNLKKSGQAIDRQGFLLQDIVKSAGASPKNVRLTFEKTGGAFTLYIEGQRIATLFDSAPLTSPYHNYFSLTAGTGAGIRDIRVHARPSFFQPERIPPETMDLQFYRYPGHTFETRIGPLTGLTVAPFRGNALRYVYMKEVTHSRYLLDKLNRNLREIEEELATAKRIQSVLANIPAPKTPSIDFSYYYQPSSQVGGDLIDIKALDKDLYAVLICDVSGHGIAASLISSMAKMSFENAFKQSFSPSKIMKMVNNDICAVTDSTMFMTAFLGVINLKKGTFIYTRAGHCLPAIFSAARANNPLMLSEGSPIIGNSPDFDFPEYEVPLRAGDRLLLYTDGIIEIRNRNDVFYDKKRLFDFIQRTLDQPLDQVRFELLKEARAFSGRNSFEDDITFMLVDVKRTGKGAKNEIK
ncbi:MAG: PP2C family protein-serine/threonine phosphatase [Fibrobacterota bacterium]